MKPKPKPKQRVARLWMSRDRHSIAVSFEKPTWKKTSAFYSFRNGIYLCDTYFKKAFGFLPAPDSCQRVRVTLEVDE